MYFPKYVTHLVLISKNYHCFSKVKPSENIHIKLKFSCDEKKVPEELSVFSFVPTL